ncbi:hypothetical protein AB5N19_12930 [Seiridium cardinale]
MTLWLSAHGAGAIKTADNSFEITASDAGSVLRPTNIDGLSGSVIFPLSGLPENPLHFVTVEVNFTSFNARVDGVAVLCNNDEVFRKERLRKTSDLTIELQSTNINMDDPIKGLALLVEVEFMSVSAQLEFRRVGLEVAVTPAISRASLRCENGTWNVVDVRAWNEPRDKTEGWIQFSVEFKSAPMVMVSLNSTDIESGANCRVKVYASQVDSRGFLVHADTWGGTKLYSCGVSWIAIGI